MMKLGNQLKEKIFIIVFLLLSIVLADSGGLLMPQQAAYDVTYYDLDLSIDPEEKTISGFLLVKVEIVDEIDSLVLDLDDVFNIDSILVQKKTRDFAKTTFSTLSGKVYIDMPWFVSIGDFIDAIIYYHGSPRISNHPPWDPGFIWEQTSTGKHWGGVVCESEGGDLWWPCKDHPSDEPDSMALHFTVPDDYVCVSNGLFAGSMDNDNGTSTFHWFVSTPINNYNVTFYIADYIRIDDNYTSVNGDRIPFNFWILPEAYDRAQNHLPVFFNEFHFLETICGPFPFKTEIHGWAHAPYWGMEHQTIIAYGNDFRVNSWGMDYIHFHELAHEWWGNLVTAKDWSDVWIHEGLGTYMEALYVEHLSGRDFYHTYLAGIKPGNNHAYPLAPITPMTASSVFGILNPYHRGAWVMHTLRFHLGDEDFFSLLKHWAYPDTSDTDNQNGRLCRLSTTDDMKEIAEQVTDRDLDPLFDVFFREAAYPFLQIDRLPDEAIFTWITESDVLLDLNVPVTVNGLERSVEMRSGQGSISLNQVDVLEIDPDQWILMDEPFVTNINDNSVNHMVQDFNLYQNYPNPFNAETKIKYSIPKDSQVNISVSNLTGELLSELYAGKKEAGVHVLTWNAQNYPSGVYFIHLRAGNFTSTIKTMLLK
jgi:aminopeptidase N